MDDVRRWLAAAPASLLVERAYRYIHDRYGVAEVDLLLVDYRLSDLLPLPHQGGLPHQEGVSHQDGPPHQRLGSRDFGTRQGGPAWRCFDRQEPVEDGGTLFVPVSVRGDRLGVLRLAAAPPDRVSDLTAVGLLLGHEIAGARSTTDRFLVGARAQRLTLAAEMQWELLPGRACSADQFTLAGQLEPAYSVRGDTFDWSVNVDRLTVAVINGMGEGVTAASLSTLATSALRNARRAGLGITDQASLADDALFAQYRGEQYVSVLLLDIDLATGRVTGIDTGSPLLVLVRGDELTEVRLAANDPLGMFEGSRYTGQDFQLQAGDRLVIVSDGVHAAQYQDRRYEGNDLHRLIRRTRGLAPLDMVRTVMTELNGFMSGELADDAAAVCLDWHPVAGSTGVGEGAAPGVGAPGVPTAIR